MNASSPKLIAIVPAAGVGSRASRGDDNVPKQYQSIAGKAMIVWSVSALLKSPVIHRVVVAISPGDEIGESLFKHTDRVDVVKTGGATRAKTVLQTLERLSLHDQDWVLVHDAARPGLPLSCLTALLSHAYPGSMGAILALPVPDTVKKARVTDSASMTVIEQTMSRDGLWLAQTPQLFNAQRLLQAYDYCLEQGIEITDDASAVEYLGDSPALVLGHLSNLKITWPHDFEMIERLIAYEIL